MKDLQAAIRAFNNERNWERYHSPKNLAMALTVECAELSEHFQWLNEEESRTPDPETLEKIREEIGDVQIYLACLADKLGINPIDAARAKMIKNAEKYPRPGGGE